MQHIYTRFTDFLSHHLRIDARYFVSGGVWLSLTQVVTIISGLAVSVLLAGMLSTNDYGTYRYLIGIGAILTSFSLSGLDQSIVQAAARGYYRYYAETIRINFIYNLGITIVGITGAFYYFYNGNDVLSLGCLTIAILQPLVNTYQNVPAFLQGKHKFKDSAIARSVKTAAVAVAVILTIFITQNVIVLLLIYLLAQFLTNIAAHVYYGKTDGEPTPAQIFRKYLVYAKNSSIRNLIVGLSNQLDTIIVFTYLGATELAIYTIANIIPQQISGSLKNLSTLLLPKYANYPDIDTIRRSMPKKSFLFFCAILIVCFLYIVLAPFIYHLLFPKYEGAIFLSQLAALSLPALIAMIPMSALQSQLKEKELYYFSLQSSVILIIFTAVLIFTHGLLGAVIARILSRYINLFLAHYHLSQSV